MRVRRCWWVVAAGVAVVCGGITAVRAERKETARPAATAPTARAEDATASDQPQNAAMAALETEVLNRINQIRQEKGLRPLRVSRPLTSIARGFSRQMAVGSFFSHEAPSGETFEDRVRSAGLGFTRIGENIYKSYNLPRPAEGAVKAWMNSAGHRHNILTPEYTETGIGVWKSDKTLYFTQDFIRPR